MRSTGLPALFKTVALQQMLIGETRRVFDTWKMDGLPYEKLLVKLKDYARNQRLDGEAARGRPAVDLNKTTAKWADTVDETPTEETPAQTEEELNALSNVKCFFCNKKGHYTSKALSRKHRRARAKGNVRVRAKEKRQTRAKVRAKRPSH